MSHAALEDGRVLAPVAPAALQPLTKPPTFSVVIPVYQGASTVADSVHSALNQVHPAHQVIVVDDGSTDHLEEALRPFGGQIELIGKEHAGAAAARNAGAAAATGEFLAILDADDAFHPRRLEALAALACRRPDLDLITTDTRFVLDGHPVGSFHDSTPFDVASQRTAILRSCFVGGWPAVRLSRLREMGGFDETLAIGHDWDCWLRLILEGSQAGLVAQPYYDYVVHAGSLTSNRVVSLWDRVRLLEKASENPALAPAERPVLSRSLRWQRQRAVRAEVEAVLFDGAPPTRMREFAFSSRLGPRTRVLAALTVIAPGLAARLVTGTRPREARFASGP